VNLLVTHAGDDRFDIDIRGHLVAVDQPVADGGADTAPTPTELFVAGLAACVAFYARRYLTRHGLPTDGLQVSADYEMGSRPARVARIDVRIALDADLPEDKRQALLAVASHCTVHNTLVQAPDVSVSLTGASAVT
jgi:uncharacterized OsmC-like protein